MTGNVGDMDPLIRNLNGELQAAAEAGSPFTTYVDERPTHRVDSLEPLVVTPYGALRNRPPRVNRPVVLMALIGLGKQIGQEGSDDNVMPIQAVYYTTDGTLNVGPADPGIVRNLLQVTPGE